jgi:hypothetical protein
MATRIISADSVGGEAIVALPDGGRPYDFEVVSIFVRYESHSPPGGQRQIRITAENEQGRILIVTGGDQQPTNQTRFYCAFADAPQERVTVGDDIQWCPWPEGLVIPAGGVIRVKAANIAAPNDIIQVNAQVRSTLDRPR